jgi:hypothetical protein
VATYAVSMTLIFCLLLAADAGAEPASQPATTPPPPPPSAPKDPPKQTKKLPSKAESMALLNKVLAEAKAANRDCTRLIGPWTRVLLMLADPSPAEMASDLESYVWLARCAEKQKYYVLLADIGSHMIEADVKKGHPELLARGYIGLNNPNAALKLLDLAEKLLPKDGDVAVTRAKVLCRVREWKQCLAAGDKALKLAGKDKEIANRAQKYRARALLHLGNIPESGKAIAASEKLGGDSDDLTEVRKASVPAKANQAVVETEHEPVVALGLFHLMGKKVGSKPLVRVFIDNVGADRTFRVDASIEGVTSVQTKSETILKGKSAVIDLSPKLAPGFDLPNMRSKRMGQVNIKVYAGDTVIEQDTEEIELQPRDFLPTAAYVDEEKAMSENLFIYMAAWVTPSAKAVEAFLAEAKKKTPRSTFAGEQSATLPQVQAIYDTLKAKGMSYVMNPEILSGVGYGQRTRLPSDVLTSTNAQCLEGAILYASLMEAIGLHSAIVLVPGHAFVAWKATPQDDPALKDKFLFLETTMTHDATFEDAVKVGGQEYDQYAAVKKAKVLHIDELRKMGISPQPYD